MTIISGIFLEKIIVVAIGCAVGAVLKYTHNTANTDHFYTGDSQIGGSAPYSELSELNLNYNYHFKWKYNGYNSRIYIRNQKFEYSTCTGTL